MDINQVTVTGRIMQNVTRTADKNGVISKLGTIGIYKGKDKQTSEPLYANIPFVAYNTATEFIKPNTKMMLVGRLNSYTKTDGSPYGKLVVQLQVNSAYPIATSQDVNVSDAF
ncbi:hypothetical protein Lp90_1603 [Lactiplantibacillus plantarum]|uniref:hypothetical protein n=1 Tax=Lactiplantibacillus plantarum TaxID=1590 RepID=UPI0004DCCE9E|nr:hypothetical protein [Lactiplantibacillus plantarum]KEZ14021.1 hypothetical protein Lp90_1603 [Lactiplantibacillus plantarum]